ncbi:hypothetical protein [Paractinoplanes durhamensis]|uniref:PH domain-containing protein n=1 Tax=Paractinoplanes durhamensis TaxID=113563 RepID=A0ABQ3YV66_9ACTN|nr:hypothetical protein [Actinoplanes durhamensis]GIE01389.1 hypothetical protein Adu01nite_27390 [Actinoplanes durhamensis]
MTSVYSIYTGRVTNWILVSLSAVLLVPLLIGSKASMLTFPVLLATAAALVNVLCGSSVRTAAGPNGVTVRLGVLGWPRRTYRIEQIRHAEVITIHPWSVAYGFWWAPLRTSFTVRTGPTLRLTLTTGRKVTITVPDAPAAVAVIREAIGA